MNSQQDAFDTSFDYVNKRIDEAWNANEVQPRYNFWSLHKPLQKLRWSLSLFFTTIIVKKRILVFNKQRLTSGVKRKLPNQANVKKIFEVSQKLL